MSNHSIFTALIIYRESCLGATLYIQRERGSNPGGRFGTMPGNLAMWFKPGNLASGYTVGPSLMQAMIYVNLPLEHLQQ